VKVSVIMPAFNAGKFIDEAIASVLSQSLTDWELIVVDDGSVDGTAATASRKSDPRIRVLSQSNAGVSAARNAGLDIARGELVTFLDADDRLPPDSLLCRVTYLASHPEVDIVNGNILVTENDERILRNIPSTTVGPFLPRLAALDESVFFGPFYMLRRASIGANRFQVGLSHCEDLCFFLELADRKRLVYGAVNADVYEYRKHAASAMSNLDGIESGYLTLIRTARCLSGMTATRMLALRWRITLIMVKTWLRRKRPLRAARAVLKIWAIG
jgi:glycosyltransferase involved in cell wall biosynthesis